MPNFTLERSTHFCCRNKNIQNRKQTNELKTEKKLKRDTRE